jgi:hypothetical protein
MAGQVYEGDGVKPQLVAPGYHSGQHRHEGGAFLWWKWGSWDWGENIHVRVSKPRILYAKSGKPYKTSYRTTADLIRGAQELGMPWCLDGRTFTKLTRSEIVDMVVMIARECL